MPCCQRPSVGYQLPPWDNTSSTSTVAALEDLTDLLVYLKAPDQLYDQLETATDKFLDLDEESDEYNKQVAALRVQYRLLRARVAQRNVHKVWARVVKLIGRAS